VSTYALSSYLHISVFIPHSRHPYCFYPCHHSHKYDHGHDDGRIQTVRSAFQFISSFSLRSFLISRYRTRYSPFFCFLPLISFPRLTTSLITQVIIQATNSTTRRIPAGNAGPNTANPSLDPSSSRITIGTTRLLPHRRISKSRSPPFVHPNNRVVVVVGIQEQTIIRTGIRGGLHLSTLTRARHHLHLHSRTGAHIPTETGITAHHLLLRTTTTTPTTTTPTAALLHLLHGSNSPRPTTHRPHLTPL
jgi:hypothetical protein